MKEEKAIICPHCGGKTHCTKACCCLIRDKRHVPLQEICRVCKGQGSVVVEAENVVFQTFRVVCEATNPQAQADRIVFDINALLPDEATLRQSSGERERELPGDRTNTWFVLYLSIEGTIHVVHAVRRLLKSLNNVRIKE